MGKHPWPKDANVLQGNDQVPHEVASRKCLDEASGTRITMHLGSPVHLTPLFVLVHDPQSEDAYQGALHEGNDVDIPVHLGARIEAVIYPRKKVAGEHRRGIFVGRMVQQEGEDDLVDMERERLESEVVGEWLGPLA